MEGAEDMLGPPEARTPEPQRFNPHALSSYSTAADHFYSPVGGARGNGLRTAEEERAGVCCPRLDMEREKGYARCDAPHTPPTISRHSWLQLHGHEEGTGNSLGVSAFPACGDEAFFKTSPTSFHPTVDGASTLRLGRSVSCPSEHRSVAPARFSLECNGVMGGARRGSGGRCTTQLSGMGASGSHGHDTPGARYSAAAALRPTILMRAATPPLHRGREALDVYPAHILSGDETHRLGAADSGAKVRENAVDRHRMDDAFADALVPRLTRFSYGSRSGGGRSPGVCVAMDRPSTMQCPDFDLGAFQQWEDGADEEPWVGGTTQVWRNSGELDRGPADATQRTAFPKENPDEEVEPVLVMAVTTTTTTPTSLAAHAGSAGAVHPRLFSHSPDLAWQPLSLNGFAAQPSTDTHDDASACLAGWMTNEESSTAADEVTGPETHPSAVQNASLTGLEDAPRKSYVRSTANSPLPGGIAGNANKSALTSDARPACDEGQCASYAQTGNRSEAGALAAMPSSYPTGPTQADEALEACVTEQQQRYCNAPLYRAAAGDVTPRGRCGGPCAQPATTTTLQAANAAADAVAAQLARLSLQASPTQKRLAFEEDEDEAGDVGDGDRSCDGNNGGPVPTARCGVNSIAAHSSSVTCGGYGAPGLSSRGRGKGGGVQASVASTNRWAGGGGGGGRGGISLSGLQLLGSRKRCLEEMQATDVEADTRASGVLRVANAPLRGSGVPPLASIQDNLKRQKREEVRVQRQQHLLPGENSGEEALIPVPVRGEPAPSAYACASASQEASEQRYPTQHLGEGMNWSQLSSISYVTPSSQSISTGMMGLLSRSSLSQPEGCVPGSVGAVACISAPCSQVLSSLPTNVTQRHPSWKQ